MRRKFFLLFLTLVLLVAAAPVNRAQAQTPAPTAAELIVAVNQVRISRGNAALEVDPILMSTAQYTAEVMASTGSCAHLGGVSARVMAAGYGGGQISFATENISCGTSKTAESIVYSDWADDLHMLPMVNASYRHIGAGVAEANGLYYFVVQAAYTTNATYVPGSSSVTVPTYAPGTTPQPTQQAVLSVQTVTPQADGSIVHIVQYGQTLYDIATAYGLSVTQLMGMNGLGDSSIRVDQRLIVRNAISPTPSLTASLTPKPPTRTVTPSRTPRPPTATRTITPTATATIHTLRDDLPDITPESRRNLGIGMIIVCGLGLIAMAVAGWRGRRPSQ